MAEERGRSRPQKPRVPRVGELRERGDEIRTSRALNHRVIAGQLAKQGEARARKPGERMKPEAAKRDLVEKTDQVVAPSRVRHLMDVDGVELSLAQEAIDTRGERDAR